MNLRKPPVAPCGTITTKSAKSLLLQQMPDHHEMVTGLGHHHVHMWLNKEPPWFTHGTTCSTTNNAATTQVAWERVSTSDTNWSECLNGVYDWSV